MSFETKYPPAKTST